MVIQLGAGFTTTVKSPPSKGLRVPKEVSRPIEKKKTFVEGLEPTPEELQDWLQLQVPYPNMAKDQETRQRAYNYCEEVVKKFQTAMFPVWDQWSLNLSFVRGTHIHDDESEIHNPATYVAVETLVPRIEETVFPNRNWFQVIGKDEMDKRDQEKIRDLIISQLDQIKYTDKANGGIRDMIQYSIATWKVYWHAQTDGTRLDYKWVQDGETEDGKRKWTCEIKQREKIVFNGPMVELVDEFDMIYDSERTSAQDMAYIGNWSRMSYSQIANLGKMGWYENWEELYEQEPLGRWDFTEWYKQERKPDYGTYLMGNRAPMGGDKQFDILEIWCRFDIYGNGRPVECVLTMANNNVVLQIRENYFHDKHRPFSLARAAREEHDLLNVGPLDHATRLNAAMDFHRGLASRSHENSITPIVLVDDQLDMPREYASMHSGKFIGVGGLSQNPGGVQQLRLASTLADYLAMEENLETDVEEVTGATKSLKGSGQADTATENVNDLREASRRLRSYVRSFALSQNEILRQIHSLNRQFCTGPIKYRTLGKRGIGMDHIYDVVEPELLNHDVDFEFSALGSIHSPELRSTELLQAMNIGAPWIEKHATEVDTLYLLRELFRDRLSHLDLDRVIRIPTPMDELLTQKQENLLLMQGQIVPVDKQDDDEHHLEELSDLHTRALSGDLEDHAVLAVMDHWNKHIIQMERKQQAQKAQSAMGPTFQPGQEREGQTGTTGNDKPYGSRLSNNAPAEHPVGETPGPATSANVPSMHRQMGAFQDQNQPTVR